MGLRIHSNIAALRVRHRLESLGPRVERSLGRLSSGLRLRGAADGPGDLGVSERLGVRIRSIQAARRNVEDGMGMMELTLGGLSSVAEILERQRELAVQALNGTLEDRDRELLDVEFQALKEEIDRLAQLEFNGIAVLADPTTITLQTGPERLSRQRFRGLDARTVGLGLSTAGLGSLQDAQLALSSIDRAHLRLSRMTASRAAILRRLESVHGRLGRADLDLSAARSRLRDADVAQESARLGRDLILQEAGVALLAQANSAPLLALALLHGSTGGEGAPSGPIRLLHREP